MPPVNNDHYYQNRLAIMKANRYSMRRLASDINLSAMTISQALRCKTTSLDTNLAIANKMGVALVKYWPELYDNTGEFTDVNSIDKINQNVN